MYDDPAKVNSPGDGEVHYAEFLAWLFSENPIVAQLRLDPGLPILGLCSLTIMLRGIYPPLPLPLN